MIFFTLSHFENVLSYHDHEYQLNDYIKMSDQYKQQRMKGRVEVEKEVNWYEVRDRDIGL